MVQIHPLKQNTQSIDISFENLQYNVNLKNGTQKKILNNLSGVMQSGQVTAILGPSGGGKTSLLNILAGKIKNGGNISLNGEIMANGKTFSNEDFTKFSGYVMQNDILLEFLTVRETIQFAADLRVKGTQEERMERVNEMIKVLKLERCQNALVGGINIKGISGGERKRVNIACELINDPQVLFLDEPTSGLDSFTAYIVIKLLKDFAQIKGKNVIMSIHSPNKDVWDLFDNVILMSQGRFVYQGKQKQIKPFFDNQGMLCPTNMCQADYYMSQISAKKVEQNPDAIINIFAYYDSSIEPQIQQHIEQIKTANQSKELTFEYFQPTFLYSVKKVAYRNVLKMKRDPLVVKSEITQMIIMAIFLGLVFLQLPALDEETTQREINNRNGILFLDMMAMFQAGMMAVLIAFPSERGVYMREENSKYYTPAAYATGKLCTDIVLKCIYPFIYGTIIFFMVGYTIDHAYQYIIYITILILLSLMGNAIGMSIGVWFDDIRTSTSITPLFILPLILFSGFFKRRTDYASWIGWIQYISPLSYSFEAILRNEYRDFENPALNPVNIFEYDIGLQQCIWILLGLYGVCQALSVVALYMKRGSIQ